MENSDLEDVEGNIFEDLFSDGSNDEITSADVKDNGDVSNENDVDKKKLKSSIEKKTRKSSQRAVLNFHRLNGPNGLRKLKKSFENFKFKGENHEKEDLTKIIQILKYWTCYQLFPKYSFEDNIAELELLGSKKPVQALMKKMRLGIVSWGIENPNTMESKDHQEPAVIENDEQNNFDSWWQEQIAQVNSSSDDDDANANNGGGGGGGGDAFNNDNDDGINEHNNSTQKDRSYFQETVQSNPEIILTPQQLERIAKNKKLAEERKLQRLANETQLSNLNY